MPDPSTRSVVFKTRQVCLDGYTEREASVFPADAFMVDYESTEEENIDEEESCDEIISHLSLLSESVS
jgi:hypothetical protein